VKTGALILAAFAMGALVTTVQLSRGDDAAPVRTAAAPHVQIEPAESAARPVARSAAVAAPGPALLHVPRLRLEARIGTSLDRGPAWWPVTGRPGGGDTIAIAGHRTTHTRPFYWLERLRSGDAIYVRWQGRVHAYRVSGRRIFSAKNLHIGDARGREVLLLTTCTPRGSARQRLVVYAWPRDTSQ
jgi:LPXTG-site transpeptidase (sortase) family protein